MKTSSNPTSQVAAKKLVAKKNRHWHDKTQVILR